MSNTPKRFDPPEVVTRVVTGHTESPSGLALHPWCPTCSAPECHPTEPGRVLIREYKVDTSSHCLVCASASGEGGYDENLVWRGPLTLAQHREGWFDDDGAGAAVALFI